MAAPETLESFGFQKVAENMWVFRRDFPYEEGISKPTQQHTGVQAVVVVEFGEDGSLTGFVPNIEDPTYTRRRDATPDRGLFFRSDDVRDMVALAQNEIGAATLETTGITAEIGFNSDGVFVTSPFMTDPWADYGLVDGQDRDADLLQIKAPGDVWGAAYETWRDEFCTSFVADASASHPSLN